MSISRSEQYFISLFHASSLRGAVERAANATINNYIQNAEREHEIPPVDIEGIAKKKGLVIRKELDPSKCEGARLVPKKGGFFVQLPHESSGNRKRFSIAHELGHTFFYRNNNEIPRHQIGVIDEKELAAEEMICNLFARTVLLPTYTLQNSVSSLPEKAPRSVLDILDLTSRRFKVSLPVLTTRLAEMHINSPPYLVLFFRFKENKSTGLDPSLRVEGSAFIGKPPSIFVWHNRSANGVNLQSAKDLFETWKEQDDRGWGRFILNSDRYLIRPDQDSASCFLENINISTLQDRKWKSVSIPMMIASCLYAKKAAKERDVYIVSVLTPAYRCALRNRCDSRRTYRVKIIILIVIGWPSY